MTSGWWWLDKQLIPWPKMGGDAGCCLLPCKTGIFAVMQQTLIIRLNKSYSPRDKQCCKFSPALAAQFPSLRLLVLIDSLGEHLI